MTSRQETYRRSQELARALEAETGAGVIVITYVTGDQLCVATAPKLERAQSRAVMAEAITMSLLADGVPASEVGEAAAADYQRHVAGALEEYPEGVAAGAPGSQQEAMLELVTAMQRCSRAGVVSTAVACYEATDAPGLGRAVHVQILSVVGQEKALAMLRLAVENETEPVPEKVIGQA